MSVVPAILTRIERLTARTSRHLIVVLQSLPIYWEMSRNGETNSLRATIRSTPITWRSFFSFIAIYWLVTAEWLLFLSPTSTVLFSVLTPFLISLSFFLSAAMFTLCFQRQCSSNSSPAPKFPCSVLMSLGDPRFSVTTARDESTLTTAPGIPNLALRFMFSQGDLMARSAHPVKVTHHIMLQPTSWYKLHLPLWCPTFQCSP